MPMEVSHLVVSRGYAPAGPVRIETGRGVLDLVVDPTGRRSSRVRVDMGEPILAPARIPVDHPGERVVELPCSGLSHAEAWWEAAGFDPRMTCVSMGNPHVVFWCRDVAAVPLGEFGPRIETDRLFPARVNVHVVQVLDRGRVRMRTWERTLRMLASWAAFFGLLCTYVVPVAAIQVGGWVRKLNTIR